MRTTLAEFGLADLLAIPKNVGYELRCRPPNPFDQEYTRMLGFGAVHFLLKGGDKGMIAKVGASLKAVPFSEFIDHDTGKAKVRMVDTDSDYYNMARSFQIRLTEQDLENKEFVDQFATLINKTPEFVVSRFAPVASVMPSTLGGAEVWV
jgi:hypothetical protein